MPTILQTSFNGGEISPRMYGRVDVERYNSALKAMVNVIPTVQGGGLGRAGTVFVCEAIEPLSPGLPNRLVPFVFDRETAYVLEFAEAKMRVIKDGVQVESSPGVPYEISSPYYGTSARQFDYAQSADTMFITHQSLFPQRLLRFGDASWQLLDIPFTTQPQDEVGFLPAATVTLSATTIGVGRTATSALAFWLPSDVGRSFKAGAGFATITGYTSATVVTCEITQPFSTNVLAGAGSWRLLDSPQTVCTPSATSPVGLSITLTLSAAGWRTENVGSLVRINGGLVRITSYTSDTVVNATIERVLEAAVGAEASSWTVEPPVWGNGQGYPATVSLYEQRLLFAGSPAFPQDIWGSVTASYYDFTRTTQDGDSFTFRIASDQLNPIYFLASVRTLLAMTYGGEFTIQGGLEKPLSPTNVQIRSRSNHGCALVRPTRIRNDELYVQRSGRKVRALSYNVANDDYTSPDMTALADHITGDGIVSMCWQQEPEGILWAVRTDGVLLSFTFDRDNNVIGWARHETDGKFLEVASVPGDVGDDVYVVVLRTVGGAQVKYIERMVDEVYPDCAYLGSTGEPGTAVWTGLDHLEGREVMIIADGCYMLPQVVTGGMVTLDRPALKVQIGLRYQRLMELLDPETQGRDGSAQGNSMRAAELSVRMIDTLGIKVNNNVLVDRNFGANLLDRPPQPFTGLKRTENLGWERGTCPTVITQDQPGPFHITGLIRKFFANA